MRNAVNPAWAVATLALLLSGCGTAANTLWWSRDEGGLRVYGGVRAETEKLRQHVADPERADSRDLLLALDLPLSLVGDTLTLPITVPVALTRSYSDPKPVNNPESGRPQQEETELITPPATRVVGAN